MDIVWAIVLLAVGFVLLVKGADWFVDGAAGIAEKLRVPQLVIGLTVVAFGTSAPELATSIISSINGDASIAVGNIVGSNITNIWLILGVAALICALPVHEDTRKMDFPVLIGATVLLLLFGLDGTVQRWEGILLFVISCVYTVVLIWWAIRQRKAEESTMSALNDHEVISTAVEETEETEKKTGFDAWYEGMKEKTWFLIVLTVVGLALVVLGANLAVNGATTIAESLGISSRVIGLTVVAIGTSLPELVTAVMAARKGDTDIAVGDIVGSCIFNILRTIGLSATILPLAFEQGFLIDGLIALAAALMLAVFGYMKDHKVKRWGGIVMLCAFAAYYVYLFVV